ncbi:MAG: caspase family protein [Rhodobacteraceae bacterium]|nr:caspase family protein [Paracoccaceae bacterium]
MTRILPYALAAAAALAAPAARAEVHALLIGVGDYAVLDADLKGPEDDVRLMAETLAARGVAARDMTVLTTGPAGLPQGAASGAPTRDGILAAMDATAAAAKPGDTVVFYFSGHGAQAPDLSGDEGGGYDEIFLPADAARWKGEIGMVENALLDDELAQWAQGMLARGVRLVGLIDACHSATGFRSVEGEGVARVLDETDLGIPEDVAGDAEGPDQALGLSGDYVFLYSSQSDERSYEYPLGDTGEWHGEFTLRLAQVLAAAPQATWRQVLGAAADAMVQGPARQVPEGEGPMLDAGVFGEAAGMQRFRIEDGKLAAGLLQGVEAGTELALYAEGAGGDPLGAAMVAGATARDATLTAPPAEGALWAEVTASPPPEPLVLAAAVRADPDDGQDYAGWQAALPAPGVKPDLVPILVDGTVALAGGDGVLDPDGPGSTPRVQREPGETEADALARALETAAHGLRLRETLAGAAGRALTAAPVIEMAIERRPAAVEGGECAAPGPAGSWTGPAAAPCDQLWLTLTNRSGKLQDVSVLYMAADFTVQPIWPQQNMVNRLAPGESVRIGLQIEASAVAGTEELWILGVPVDKDSGQRVDLTRLATPEMTRAYAGASDAMALWLEDRLTTEDGAAMRGFSLKPAALTMIRQIVRLNPGVGVTPFEIERTLQ